VTGVRYIGDGGGAGKVSSTCEGAMLQPAGGMRQVLGSADVQTCRNLLGDCASCWLTVNHQRHSS
jgi:hypothetical protein